MTRLTAPILRLLKIAYQPLAQGRGHAAQRIKGGVGLFAVLQPRQRGLIQAGSF